MNGFIISDVLAAMQSHELEDTVRGSRCTALVTSCMHAVSLDHLREPGEKQLLHTDLIRHGTMSMHPEDQERWYQTFCRENQLKLHAEGKTEIHLRTRQIGDDGIYRRVETSNYFVKSPSSEDILVISLCNNLEDTEEK